MNLCFIRQYRNNPAAKQFFSLAYNVGGMDSKGLRAAFVSIVAEVGAGLKPSQTTETLIGYTACCLL
jgi:hypothetical protein